jgi:hypothetical protein
VTTTKLGLMNAALVQLGTRRLADTGEANEAGRELTAVYDNVLLDCLSEASWNFATETIQVDADTGVTPEFGYENVFAKPSDWLRTVAVSGDEFFSFPLLDYYDDKNFWSASIDPVYIRYVSGDTGMGLDLSRWTPAFRRYVELELAARVCLKVTQNASLEGEVEKKRDKARINAKIQDGMNEPNPKFPPPGSWTMSRWGRNSGERGRRSRLTG